MSLKRRSFIKLTGALASGFALHSLSSCGFNPVGSGTENITKNFGLQLYTLRDVMGSDTRNVLEQVASFGYKQIESFEGPQGMFWGMTPKGFKDFMDGLGMKIVASHADIYKDFDRKVDDAASIGMDYLICPWVGPQKTIDDYKKIADQFNKAGETCKKAGLRFAYHNHAYTYTPLEGQLPQDVFMDNTDADLVDYEMDIYWVVTAGKDPIAEMKKHENRYRLVHVKDRKKNVPLTNTDASCILGEGSIDYPSILKGANRYGTKFYIVEQEKYDNSSPMASVRANAAYMKSLNV